MPQPPTEERLPPAEPDLRFIEAVAGRAGGTYRRCFQCGTCSRTCALSPASAPFPRKEMAWAVWGLRDQLLRDPDVWLCHQCNDCSTQCPRDARPGDVLAAVRLESILHYSFPRFLARWVNHPRYIPLLLAIPAGLLALALFASTRIEPALGLSRDVGERVIYSYSSHLHHWVVNSFYAVFCLLALVFAVAGVLPFWWAMKAADARDGAPTEPVKISVRRLRASSAALRPGDFDFAAGCFDGCGVGTSVSWSAW